MVVFNRRIGLSGVAVLAPEDGFGFGPGHVISAPVVFILRRVIFHFRIFFLRVEAGQGFVHSLYLIQQVLLSRISIIRVELSDGALLQRDAEIALRNVDVLVVGYGLFESGDGVDVIGFSHCFVARLEVNVDLFDGRVVFLGLFVFFLGLLIIFFGLLHLFFAHLRAGGASAFGLSGRGLHFGDRQLLPVTAAKLELYRLCL